MDKHHDELICKVFIKKNGIPNGHRTKRIDKHPNIREYLDNRYNDSQSYTETIGRIKFNCEIRPVCKVCGKSVEYLGIYKGIYLKWRPFCCLECEGKGTWQKHKETNKRKYGIELTQRLSNIKEKVKKTCIEKYGVDHPMRSKEIQDKCKQYFMEKYGVESPMKSKEIQEKQKEYFMKKYKVKYSWLIPGVKEKSYISKKKNNTFNTSKPEEELYLYIREKFPKVERQYNKDNRYPWKCDFYIPNLDCFIEYNGFQSHGPHPYNPKSIEDQIILKRWKGRYNNGEHPLYKRMIEGWTIRDVEKRNKAKEENLNFHEFWNLKDAKEFIDNLKSI